MRIVLSLLVFFALSTSAMGEQFYVTLNGNGNQDGSSWSDAWSWPNLNNSANWGAESGKINAGDTVYISGGSSGQSYTGPLTIHASGSEGSPITFKPGSASPSPSGHDGLVTIQNSNRHNVDIGDYDWIIIDGEKNGVCNIKNLNADEHGVYASSAIGIVIKYMEITGWNNASGTSVDAIKLASCRRGNEIAYCTIYSPTYGSGVDAIHLSADWSYSHSYGHNSVHHCSIYDLPDDGINIGAGVDIYNNTIDSQNPTLRSYGHPDGIPAQGRQSSPQKGSHHVRIWNNTIKNFANGLIFFEGFNDITHVRIYNNIFEFTSLVTTSSWEGISIAVRAGESGDLIDDVVVANNTFANIPGKSIEFKQLESGGSITNTSISNNILINNACANTSEPAIHVQNASGGGSLDLDLDNNGIVDGRDGVEIIDWQGIIYSVSSFNSTFSKNNSNSDPSFTSYTDIDPYRTNNDYTLQSSDTSAKDQGIDLSSLTNMLDWPQDKDGVSRPQGSAWDIGAYEFHQGPSAPTNLRIVQ